MMVRVVDQQLDEIVLIDEDTSEEEHIAVVAHFLEVGLKGIGVLLMRRDGICGIMVEQGVPVNASNP